MVLILMLWSLAPISIYLGLIVFNNIILTFLLFYGLVCLIIPMFDLMIIQRKSMKEYLNYFGFKNFRQTFMPSFTIGIFFCIFIFIFFVLLQKYILNISQVQAVLYNWNIDEKYIIPFMLTMIIANSIFEEIYWRGYIYKKLECKVSLIKVIVITSIFYASYHLITLINLFSLLIGISFTSVIFGIGLFWGHMKKKYNSIYFSIISHLLADLGIMLIYLKYFGN